MRTEPRSDIYYWKCDRPAFLHGTARGGARRAGEELQRQIESLLIKRLGAAPGDLRAGGGQGNHFIFRATIAGKDCMVRVEDGPERDDYMEIEAHVAGLAKQTGVPGWNFLGVDSSRAQVPFAWQIVERVPGSDLNALLKEGRLDLPSCAEQIGAHVARWQSIRPEGFGPFRPDALRAGKRLAGYHQTYGQYYNTRLEAHLDYLAKAGFISNGKAADIAGIIRENAGMLRLPDTEGGCLVHKDLALWNIVGDAPDHIAAVIDWDDTVSGDPMDDISLLGCFHGGDVIARAMAGYASLRELPPFYEKRFWLHLLRNMIWKSVIRVGAGYFGMDSGLFLIGSGSCGGELRKFTLGRIDSAIRGLRGQASPENL